MDGHERDAVGGLVLLLVLIGEERHLAEEVGEQQLVGAFFTVSFDENADGLEHLLHVLLPCDALHGTILEEFCGDTAALNDQLGHLHGLQVVVLSA